MPIGSFHFVSPNNPILTQSAHKIPIADILSEQVQHDIETMVEVAFGEQKGRSKPVLVGLAAPQIGISKRIILVDIGADGHGGVSQLEVYINPVITRKSEQTAEWYEGCFSTGQVCGIVKRSVSVSLSAHDRNGEVVHQEFSGYVARVFQHEIDHLNGIVFVDHITDDKKLHWVEQDQFPQYRNREAWRTWTDLCPRDKWLQVCRGE
jgi:peptide deformylase